MKQQSILVLAMVLVCFTINTARADLMPLHNTGEAGDGMVEANYILTYAAKLVDTPVAMTAYGTAAYPPWVTPPAGSQWISPTTDFTGLGGLYFYELNFSIPQLISISGYWTTDNYGEIFLNGATTGITRGDRDFGSLAAFNITSGFTGNDTLVFRVGNLWPSPTGLLVTDLTAEVVPVPSAIILGSLGLTFSGWLLKRKRMV